MRRCENTKGSKKKGDDDQRRIGLSEWDMGREIEVMRERERLNMHSANRHGRVESGGWWRSRERSDVSKNVKSAEQKLDGKVEEEGERMGRENGIKGERMNGWIVGLNIGGERE